MSNINGFRCIDCQKLHKPDRLYTCPDCEGNLEIEYDFSKVKEAFSKAPLASNPRKDIWRYLPLLPINDLSLIPSLRIGGTPLYHSKRLGAKLKISNLYLKDDTCNPSASFKDRASAIALVNARELGLTRVTGASTGNAGSSMACLSANVGVEAIIFVPQKAPRAKIAQLLTFGARVIAVRGTYDEAFDLCLKVSKEYGWYNRNTGFNPYTREGKKTCALEILEQFEFNPPDRVFVPVGDGNMISGIWKGFKDAKAAGLTNKTPKIVAVQSDKSNAIVKAVQSIQKKKDSNIYSFLEKGAPVPGRLINIDQVSATTIADSISVDIPRDGRAGVKAVLESGGECVEVSDEEILEAIKDLAQGEGVFSEPAGATALAGVKKLNRQGHIDTKEKVVCLVTGNGLKDIESAMKVAGEPLLINPDLESVKKALSLGMNP